MRTKTVLYTFLLLLYPFYTSASTDIKEISSDEQGKTITVKILKNGIKMECRLLQNGDLTEVVVVSEDEEKSAKATLIFAIHNLSVGIVYYRFFAPDGYKFLTFWREEGRGLRFFHLADRLVKRIYELYDLKNIAVKESQKKRVAHRDLMRKKARESAEREKNYPRPADILDKALKNF